MDKLKHNRFLHFIPIFVFMGYLAWHMLAVTQYNQLQWWQYLASDFECGVVTSALGLMNDGQPITHVLYPAVTLFNFESAALRLSTLWSSHYHDIFYVDGFANIKEVFMMLNEAIGITRLNVLPMTVFLAVMMYFLFFYLLKNKTIACLWTLFFISEKHVLYYNYVMRPEVFSLAFFFLLVYLSIQFFHREDKGFSYSRCAKYFMFIGLCMGLSLFSKIQIFPALIIYFGLMFFYLFKESKIKSETSAREVKFCLFNTIGNVLIFPWWTMARPDHVTPELLRRWPWYDLYGPPPGKESFLGLPIIFFIALFAVTLTLMALSQNKRGESFSKRATPILIYINMLMTGIIFSVYVIGLGALASRISDKL